MWPFNKKVKIDGLLLLIFTIKVNVLEVVGGFYPRNPRVIVVKAPFTVPFQDKLRATFEKVNSVTELEEAGSYTKFLK